MCGNLLLLLLLAIDIWFMPAKDISNNLLSYHQKALENGQVDVGMISLQTGWRFKLLCGENLSVVFEAAEARIRLMVRSNIFLCIFHLHFYFLQSCSSTTIL